MVARITEKVDLIVAGHSHSILNTRVNNIPIVQSQRWGTAVSVTDIPLDANGKVAGPAVAEVRQVLTNSTEPYAPVDSMIKAAAARVAPIVNRKLGTLTTSLERRGNQYPLGNIVADAFRWAGKGDVGFTNTGGIRTRLPAGDITYGKLFVIQPFGNNLYRMRMTGSQLRAYVEKLLSGTSIGIHLSGIKVGYDPEKPAGSRITSLLMADGKALSDDATYVVVMNNFMAEGGSNMPAPGGTESTSLPIFDVDAMADYIKSRPQPIVPPEEVRIFISK